MSLVDAEIAPPFMRLDFFEEKAPLKLFSGDSKVTRWSEKLLSLSSVKNQPLIILKCYLKSI